MAHNYPYDILLAGIGTGGKKNTTLATIELLREARIAFSLSVHRSLVQSVCRKVVDLTEAYFTGEEDERVYERLARMVLAESRYRGGVAVVDDGHPLLYDDVNEKIVRRARQRGLKVVVLPAVSCIDAMMAECGLLLTPIGTQIVEATTLVLHRQRLNPSMDTLVLQLGWFGSSLLTHVRAHTCSRFLPLQQHLMKFFPATHPVRILRAVQRRGEEPTNVRCRLGHLALRFKSITTDCSLHIPALESKRGLDPTLLRQLTDREHLLRVARVE